MIILIFSLVEGFSA